MAFYTKTKKPKTLLNVKFWEPIASINEMTPVGTWGMGSNMSAYNTVDFTRSRVTELVYSTLQLSELITGTANWRP